jgi:hypothetical protein
MIEKDLMQYLQKKTSLTTALGGTGKIYAIQAPTGASMPWLIIEPTGGSRTRISASRGEATNMVRIGVDAGPSNWITGRNAIEYARIALENLRGKLGDATDIVVTVGEISGYPGLNGSYRYSFPATCKYTYAWSTQQPST